MSTENRNHQNPSECFFSIFLFRQQKNILDPHFIKENYSFAVRHWGGASVIGP